MMLLQCEEAGGKNPLGPPACLRFRFLPTCRHYGSLESRNSKIPPDCHPYRSKLLYCKWHYLLHPPKTVHYHNYRLFNNTTLSCCSYLVFSQTNKQNIFYSYTWPKCYIPIWRSVSQSWYNVNPDLFYLHWDFKLTNVCYSFLSCVIT